MATYMKIILYQVCYRLVTLLTFICASGKSLTFTELRLASTQKVYLRNIRRNEKESVVQRQRERRDLQFHTGI